MQGVAFHLFFLPYFTYLAHVTLSRVSRSYEAILKLDPRNVAVHANLALVKLQLKDGPGALEHCDVVLAATGEGLEAATRLKAQHRRAQALALMGRLEEALEAYKWVRFREGRRRRGVSDSFSAISIWRLAMSRARAGLSGRVSRFTNRWTGRSRR